MAQVSAPFLSLNASGKFADTMVAFNWKGLKIMRQYKVPTNPRTTGQVAQRDLFTAAVNAWRNYFTVAEGREAWNRSALVSGKPQSGFNVAMSAMTQIAAGNADASFAATGVAFTGETVKFTMKNVDDGATGDEAGDFEIWVGDSPSSLLKAAAGVAIAAGAITTADLGDVSDVKYVKIRKDGQDRSGISKATLIA